MNAGGLTCGELLEVNALKYGNRIGYVQGERSLTHRQYLDRARCLADAIHRRKVRLQDRVAVLSTNNLEFLEVYGACELAGFIIATVNYRLSPPEALAILLDAAPVVLIFEAAYEGVVDGIRARLKTITTFVCIGNPPAWAERYEEFLAAGSIMGPPIRACLTDIAHLIYTSGTTGRPKGVMLAHGPLTAKAQLHAGDMDVIPDDRFLIVMPVFHVGARGVISAGQWRGAAIHLQSSFEPGAFLQMLSGSAITIAHLAPMMIKAILEDPLLEELDFASLKVICYSAAPMPLATLRRGLDRFGPVFHQSYGQTEGMVSSLLRSQHRPDGSDADRQRLRSVGQPYPRTQVRIIDEDGQDVPTGEPGEI